MNAPSETVPVDDLDQFVRTLTAWHMAKCATVQHLLTVPEGSEFMIGQEGEVQTSVVLTGDVLEAFKLGIEMTMMQLGTLPFVAEMEEDEPAPAVPG